MQVTAMQIFIATWGRSR